MQFIKFGTVGVFSVTLHYTILIVLAEAAEINPVVASSIGYIISAVFNYLLNHRFTFTSEERHLDAVPKFLVVMGLGLVINSTIMYLLVEMGDMHYQLAQFIAIVVVLFWHFVANRAWTFRTSNVEPDPGSR